MAAVYVAVCEGVRVLALVLAVLLLMQNSERWVKYLGPLLPRLVDLGGISGFDEIIFVCVSRIQLVTQRCLQLPSFILCFD